MPAAARSHSPFSLFRNPEFFAISTMNFATGMTFATIIIALALYADLFQASGVVAALFGSGYALTRLLLVLPVGRYADVGNAKRFLLIGMGLHMLVLVGFIFIQTVEHVVILRTLQGGGSIIVYITGTAVIGSIAVQGERGLYVGTHNQVASFSSLSGDLVGGLLLFLFGFELTYLVLIAVSAVASLAVWIFLRDEPIGGSGTTTGLESLVLLIHRRVIMALVTFRFSFSFGKMAVILFLPIYARTEFAMSALLIGGILAGGKLTKSIAQGYVGAFADRVGHMNWFIVAGIAGYALGTALIPFAPLASGYVDPVTVSAFGETTTVHPAFFYLFGCYAILGLADSLRIPTSVALFVREGEHFEAVGSSLSLRSVSWQIGAIIGPLAVGGMLDLVSFMAAFWLAAGFMLVAGVLFVLIYAEEPIPEHGAVPADD